MVLTIVFSSFNARDWFRTKISNPVIIPLVNVSPDRSNDTSETSAAVRVNLATYSQTPNAHDKHLSEWRRSIKEVSRPVRCSSPDDDQGREDNDVETENVPLYR